MPEKKNRKSKLPGTLVEAIRYFADLDVATEFVASLRWPDGPICPDCGHKEHSYLSTRRLWKCKNCKRQFSVKVGTIFEDSPLPLDKWLVAIWMVANCKNGVSSHELARTVGITQKSAWFVLHRVRLAMQTGSFVKYSEKFGGAVEVDETFIGGRARYTKAVEAGEKKGPRTGKTAVAGFLQRGGEVTTQIVDDLKRPALQREVRKRVEPGAIVITDELRSYLGLDQHYQHLVINHADKYVDGQIHTNGLENFWSLLKRGLAGTYVSVEPFHLFRYLDEQTFRYNRRNLTDVERVQRVLGKTDGRRVTYRELTGKDQKPPEPKKPTPRKPRGFPMGPF
ncbi:MAG: IS1595 family transposase [Actinomycetota bacterium]|nr:IS1595 family transposase [Actinomycetota bacterium]